MHIAHPISRKCTPLEKNAHPKCEFAHPYQSKCTQQRPFVKLYWNFIKKKAL